MQSVEAAEESRSSAAGGLEELGDGVELNQKVADARGQTADARTKASEARGALEAVAPRRRSPRAPACRHQRRPGPLDHAARTTRKAMSPNCSAARKN